MKLITAIVKPVKVDDIKDALHEAENTRIGYAKAALAVKKTTITCVKGKLTKKVTGINPKCPSGYKKK